MCFNFCSASSGDSSGNQFSSLLYRRTASAFALSESGLFLKVHSYSLLEDQVRLHIAADSYLVVPRATLASIESDGRVVYRHQANPPDYLLADDDLADDDLDGEIAPSILAGRGKAPAIAALAPAVSLRR